MTIELAYAREVPEWASDEVARARFDRQSVEIPRYAEIESRFDARVQRLIEDRLNAKIDQAKLVQLFKQELTRSETEAFLAGRRAGGNRSTTITEAEAKMLAGRHSRNMRYFNRFARDIEAGRGRMPYARRGSLYAKSLWSLYSRGESVDWTNQRDGVYDWLLDVDAEHCRTCLKRAALSRSRGGFLFDELIEIGFPGENTDCGSECRCSVVFRRQKQLSPDDLPRTPAKSADGGVETLEKLLGGKSLPVRIPAAGIPYVALARQIVEASIMKNPPKQREALAKKLPLIPRLLSRPAKVNDLGSVRTYQGYGLELTVARDAEGLWRVFAISLLSPAARAA